MGNLVMAMTKSFVVVSSAWVIYFLLKVSPDKGLGSLTPAEFKHYLFVGAAVITALAPLFFCGVALFARGFNPGE